jgi:peptidoglycan-associated lipoprotein
MKVSATLLSLMCAVGVAAGVGCSKKAKKDEAPAAEPKAAKPAPVETPTEPTDDTPARDPAELGQLVYFEFDSAALSPATRAVLENNVKWLAEDSVRTLTIEGHTDQQGTTEYNIALGDRRAKAAKDYMIALGADGSKITIVSYGEERPASGSDDAANRRGVFISER